MEIVGAESEFAASSREMVWVRRRRGNESQTKREKQKTENGNHSETPPVVGHNLDELPLAVQRKVLQPQLAEFGVVADFELVERLRKAPGKWMDVGAGESIAREATGKISLREHAETSIQRGGTDLVLQGRAGEANLPARKFAGEFSRRNNSGCRSKKTALNFLTRTQIGGEIILRHWRAGDRFQPIGLKSAVKLQDLFVNAKISAARRRELVLATTAAGEIFWVEGLRIGERFKLTPQTTRKLVWKWSNLAV